MSMNAEEARIVKQKLSPISWKDVTVNGGFWLDKQQINSKVTIVFQNTKPPLLKCSNQIKKTLSKPPPPTKMKSCTAWLMVKLYRPKMAQK